jgi:hypothetical protein
MAPPLGRPPEEPTTAVEDEAVEEEEIEPAALDLPPLTLPPPPSSAGLAVPAAPGAPDEPPAADTDAVLEALDDPETREVVVIAGRRPRVRTSSGWQELGFDVSTAGWNDLWRDVAGRTGAPLEPSIGHLAHLGPGGLVVEAMLPPLSDDPVLHVRRRPPQATLDSWADDGRLEGDVEVVRDALANRRGVLVVGDRGSGRTSFLEALAGGTPTGERVAAVEMLPQLRVAGALRLRLDPSNPAPALGAARAAMAEWLVLDDASPQAVGAAAVEAEANRAGLLVSARAADADAWLAQVARSIAYEVADADAFVGSALPVVVRVETGPDGRPRARIERS